LDFSFSLFDFTVILGEILNAQLGSDANSSVIHDLLSGLRVEELVLARACAAGNERAWDVFFTRYREGLYTAAMSIARDDELAHDLADSLYADLFGTEGSQGRRVSKLSSYLGIGSLQGWLRTVLAHGFIDRYRMVRPVESLTSLEEDESFELPAPPAATEKAVDPRVESATDDALQSLDPEDRYLLASYFLHGRTLAEIGRTLGLHESTVSRRIDKSAGRVRKKIATGLARGGMSRAAVEEALDLDVRDLQVNVGWRLEENPQDRRADPSLGQESSGTGMVQSNLPGKVTEEGP
jgi:RNA polymerase sigma-70 factor (ECF subfamily)